MHTRWFEDGCPARGGFRRLRLRHAALAYAAHGWRVVAGARLCGERFSCGPNCRTVACHPLSRLWEQSATADSTAIVAQWHSSPHSVLLATGEAFDVVDVPAHIGAAAGDQVRGPVAVTPSGRWMFLVRPGGDLCPQLAQQHNVVLHGSGSWIPAPPVRMPEGRVRWAVAPQETDWRIPDIGSVQAALAATLPRRGAHGSTADRSA
jgi:hypothetical protein